MLRPVGPAFVHVRTRYERYHPWSTQPADWGAVGHLGEPALDARPHLGVGLARRVPDLLLVPPPLPLLLVPHHLRLPVHRWVAAVRHHRRRLARRDGARSVSGRAPAEGHLMSIRNYPVKYRIIELKATDTTRRSRKPAGTFFYQYLAIQN
jgi:hypothetical protein